MKRLIPFLLGASLVLVTASLVAPVSLAGGNINGLIGQKNQDKNFSDTESVQDQDMLGLMLDWGSEGWPVNFAIDLISSSKDTNDNAFNVKVKGSTFVADVGVRWYFVKGKIFEPYVGGGLNYTSAKVETDGASNDLEFDDSALGYWLNGGIKWVFAEHFNVGGDVRWDKAEISTEDGLGNTHDIEAGGLGYGLILGYRW